MKVTDADGRPVLDAEGREVEAKDASGEPMWVMPHPDPDPEPEPTPEEEAAAEAELERHAELKKAGDEAVAQYRLQAAKTQAEVEVDPDGKPVRHSDRDPPSPVTGHPSPMKRRG